MGSVFWVVHGIVLNYIQKDNNNYSIRKEIEFSEEVAEEENHQDNKIVS